MTFSHRSILVPALVAMVVCLAACSSGDLGPAHDVAYFKAHPADMKKVLEVCQSNPGKYKLEQNCINASKASFDNTMTKPDNLPRLPDNLSAKGAHGDTYQ